jgi:hypothetical protein
MILKFNQRYLRDGWSMFSFEILRECDNLKRSNFDTRVSDGADYRKTRPKNLALLCLIRTNYLSQLSRLLSLLSIPTSSSYCLYPRFLTAPPTYTNVLSLYIRFVIRISVQRSWLLQACNYSAYSKVCTIIFSQDGKARF